MMPDALTEKSAMTADPALIERLDRIQRVALIASGAAWAIFLVDLTLDGPGPFFQSYLFGYLFWAAITIGCIPLCMMHYLFGGAWGAVILRLVESGMRTLLLIALLFVPILLGIKYPYVWANHDVLSRPENAHLARIVLLKRAYLNVPFFAGRAAFYFVVWGAIAYFLMRWSAALDRTADRGYARALKRLSAGGMPFVVLTITFAAFDWVMSLSPSWYSGIFGLQYGTAETLEAFAFILLLTEWFSRRPPLAEVLKEKQFNDLGKVLLAFVMFWAYLILSQLIIIYSANLPREAQWYVARVAGNWRWVAWAIGILHFGVPFVLLLPSANRRRGRTLAGVAGLLLVMRFVDLYWQVIPSYHRTGFALEWQDLAAPMAIGGLWVAFFIRQLKRHTLIPLNDPYLIGAHEHA